MTNKKNLFLLGSVALMLSSCFGQGKIKSIVDFTPRLTAEAPGHKVLLPQAKASSGAWLDGADWVNSAPKHFALQGGLDKFSKSKVTKGKIVAAPIVGGQKLILLSDKGLLFAYETSSYNKSLWSTDLKASVDTVFAGGGMTYHNNHIFLTHGTRDLVAIEDQNGKELWRRRMPDVVRAQPTIHMGALLVQTLNNQTYAVSMDNGKILWAHDGMPEVLSTGRNIAPIVHKGKVIVGYSSGQLVALSFAGGEEVWQMNLSREGEMLPSYTSAALESQPIIDGDMLYVASGNGFLLKINSNNGAIEWQRKVQDIQSMNKSGNTIFVVTNGKQVAAINENDGKVVWATDLDPAVEGAKPKARKPVELLTPVVINDELIVISSDGFLRALSPYTGEVKRVVNIDKGAQYLVVGKELNIFTRDSVLVSK